MYLFVNKINRNEIAKSLKAGNRKSHPQQVPKPKRPYTHIMAAYSMADCLNSPSRPRLEKKTSNCTRACKPYKHRTADGPIRDVSADHAEQNGRPAERAPSVGGRTAATSAGRSKTHNEALRADKIYHSAICSACSSSLWCRSAHRPYYCVWFLHSTRFDRDGA